MVCSVIESNRLRCVKTIGVFDYVEILFHSKSERAHGGRERERGGEHQVRLCEAVGVFGYFEVLFCSK